MHGASHIDVKKLEKQGEKLKVGMRVYLSGGMVRWRADVLVIFDRPRSGNMLCRLSCPCRCLIDLDADDVYRDALYGCLWVMGGGTDDEAYRSMRPVLLRGGSGCGE